MSRPQAQQGAQSTRVSILKDLTSVGAGRAIFLLKQWTKEKLGVGLGVLVVPTSAITSPRIEASHQRLPEYVSYVFVKERKSESIMYLIGTGQGQTYESAEEDVSVRVLHAFKDNTPNSVSELYAKSQELGLVNSRLYSFLMGPKFPVLYGDPQKDQFMSAYATALDVFVKRLEAGRRKANHSEKPKKVKVDSGIAKVVEKEIVLSQLKPSTIAPFGAPPNFAPSAKPIQRKSSPSPKPRTFSDSKPTLRPIKMRRTTSK